MIRKVGKNEIMTISYKEDKDNVIAELEVIAARERKSRSQLVMELIESYVKAHSTCNSTFKLDMWNENPGFKAVPTIMASQETWFNYLNECSDKERLDIQIKTTHINEQCRFINPRKK